MNETAPAGIGDNRPPPGLDLRNRLAEDYAELAETAARLVKQANASPAAITDDDTVGVAGDLIKEISACSKRAEKIRVDEKEPFLQGGRDVDGFFKTLTGQLEKAKGSLEKVVGVYLRAKAAEERRAREEAERKAREEAERKMREAEEAERERQEIARRREAKRIADEQAAREAEAAEVAANEPQTIGDLSKPFEVDPDVEAETQATLAADHALEDAAEHETQAEIAAKAAAAKPAELARTRSDAGSVSTLREFWDFTVDDYDAIPLAVLRPYIDRANIDKAVRAYVKHGGRQLDGVRIFKDERAMVR
jgi:hypothetical protein